MTAISVVKRWVPGDRDFVVYSERFAIQLLQLLLLEHPPALDHQSVFTPPDNFLEANVMLHTRQDPRTEWTEDEAARYVELLLALCSKKPELLKRWVEEIVADMSFCCVEFCT